ncbi:MAG: hypothetical protein AAGU27_10825 [Dehalobacterium sp.]
MPNVSYATIILFIVLAILVFSLVLSWRKKAALKPNLAQMRHETEADILAEHENKKEEN